MKLSQSPKHALFGGGRVGRGGARTRRDVLRRRLLVVEPLESRRLLTQGAWPALDGEPPEGESLPTEVAFRLEVTDLSGAPITHAFPGSDVFLLVWVSDQREFADPAGVYAAYLDVAYDENLLAVVPADNKQGFDITYGTWFENGQDGTADVPGLIDEVGAFQTGFAPLGPGEHLLFRVRFTAGDVVLADDQFAGVQEDSGVTALDVLNNDLLHAGTATFAARAADVRPLHDVLLFDPPRVVPDAAVLFLGTELAITDVDQAAITDVGVPTAGGVVRVAEGGTHLLYRPAPDFYGTESFTYTVAGVATATVSVVVEPVSDAPVAADDIFSVGLGETLAVDALHGVLVNDVDADGDPLSVSLAQPPAFGSITLQDDGGFLYTPEGGFQGRDQFTYIAHDAELSSLEATVLIDVGTPQVQFRLEVTDEAGQTVEHITGDESLRLRGWVQDLRDEHYVNRGLNSAYFDVLYDDEFVIPVINAALPLGFEIDFGSAFHEPGSGNVEQPGLLDEVGSFSLASNPLGADEVLLFDMPLALTGPRPEDDQVAVSFNSQRNELDLLNNDLLQSWTAHFSSRGADLSPTHDIRLFEPPVAVSQERVVYVDTSVQISNDAALSIVAVSASAEGGTVELSGDGRHVVYTPPAGFHGTDTFHYTVADGLGREAVSVASISVLPSWQNLGDPLDVNDDSYISPIDALLVINDLNRHGGRPLVEPSSGPPFLDVNGDGSVTPLDALLVINYLNRLSGDGEGESGAPARAATSDASRSREITLVSHPPTPPVAPASWQLAWQDSSRWTADVDETLAAGIVQSLPTPEHALDHLYRRWERRAAAPHGRLTLDELLELWEDHL